MAKRHWQLQVFERPNGEKECGWHWPAEDVIVGLSQPFDYFGKPPEHQQSRRIT